ncbi:MAG TPA: histidine kinase dimerization/phosphoacceptor domain-containing protein, partial [Bacillota bacterium]|nr:histidine kinase dimerization/phosphoacceptor domain-containing protein [Bacillota bacterium]
MLTNLHSKVVFAIVQIFIHFMVVYYFQQGKLVSLFPDKWSEQFVLVVLLLSVLSLLMLFIPWQSLQKGLFFIRMFFLMVIAIPFAENPGNFGLLYILHAFECFIYFNQKTAFTLCSLYIFFNLWVANQQILLWDFYHPKHSAKMGSFFVLAFHCILGGTVGHWTVKEYRQRAKERKLFEELQNSNRCLAEANIGLQNVAAQAELASVFKERTRIAREIHDSIAYTFTNLIALLNACLLQTQSE